MFNNLRELILSMPTEETCREYLVQQRWNGSPVCPYCGSGKVYRIENGKRFKCGNPECYKKYSVTVGTVMEASNVPLVKWFTAIYFISAHKKGISSYQLAKDIGVTQQTGWFILHRIREMMRDKSGEKLDNIVEVDETYVGGIVGNMSKSRRAKLRTEAGGTVQNKTMVVGMIERSGKLKLLAMGKANGVAIVQPLIRENIDTDAVLITDSSYNYDGLNKEYAGHEIVNHSKEEYVRDGSIHTNSIEGAFSLLKRSIIGIYHQVTPAHLHRYCDETMFRYNFRKMNDAARFSMALTKVEGRLKYQDLIKKENKVKKPIYVSQRIGQQGKKRAVAQFKDGVLINTFESVTEAAKMTGTKKQHISAVITGRNRSTRGFQWKYA